MFELPSLVDQARQIVAGLDPRVMTGASAAAMVRHFAELERIASAGRLLLAHRVAETHAWEGHGHRDEAEWMAAQTGGSLAEAKDAFETSRNLLDQPALDDALRAGALSAEKAAAVSEAAKQKPAFEDELVGKAKHSPLSKTREECNKAKAAGEDAEERAKRCWANRRAYFTTERDGMVGLFATGPVAEMAKLRAAVEKRTDQLFRLHNRAKEPWEPRDRYAFDAVVQLACGEGGTGKTKTRVNAQVRIDIAALWRGWVEEGEVCDAPGVGALTVSEVERLLMAEDTLIDAVITRGTDVIRTARVDRYLPAQHRRALELRDPCCGITGCTWRGRLENHHSDGYAKTRSTSVEELDRYCPPHHWLVTHRSWVITKHADGTKSIAPPAEVEERCRTG